MSPQQTVTDKLLLAAFDLEAAGRSTFSAEDLVVAAWRRFPEEFGLPGYLDKDSRPQYPNSNRVYAEIMGSKPLRKQGLLRKVGSKLYRLTEAGRARALARSGSTDSGGPKRVALRRQDLDFIRRLHESRAAARARAGSLKDISFFEACGFWGISAQSTAKDLHSRFADIEAVVESVRSLLAPAGTIAHGRGAVSYAKEDVDALGKLHRELQDRFRTEIATILQRTDERRP